MTGLGWEFKMNGGSCLSVQILVYTVHLLAEADGFKKNCFSVNKTGQGRVFIKCLRVGV